MENEKNKNIIKNKWTKGGIILFGLIAVVGFIIYWQASSSQIKIDKSHIEAPTIGLSSTVPGILEEVFVNEGDNVAANYPVARINDELIKTKVSGTIISTKEDVGTIFAAGSPVVTMINPSQLRVIGTIEEDKGLENIKIGQMAVFTVDAFKSKKYEGIVDEIAPASNESSVVFSISDKRETKMFNIKIRFNPDKYP